MRCGMRKSSEDMASGITCPATVVSYGPTTIKLGAMFRPCGWTLTAVADAEMSVGEMVTPCVCVHSSVPVMAHSALACTMDCVLLGGLCLNQQ